MPELPDHPWPEAAEALYQKSLEAAMYSAMLSTSPSSFMREMALSKWAESRLLGDMAVEMLSPPKLVMIW